MNAEERMQEVLSGISPESTGLILVTNNMDGFEVFSRFDNKDTALILMEAAQQMLRQHSNEQ